ncbi:MULTISPECIES: squalene--hopene cyclase [Nitrosomonas]|uniref:Prenyltransferase and squalene oxidase repeats n=1 Tax=Nitrosomonas europaea (strain ATCC 19718 / CIP 103999 / KCTC 2705 / NBRC 14298) TaxID=228410 RepID=Q82VC6_NITEU|nr:MULTISPECIES: squalene--hopene cyclase [Nitrosomonas]CAD85079.1 Prenyltransferase and squalene oxidase repeats [Nitrosomonas europaea ATCC 19718]SDW53766.1 squalene-hopene/tetraprenyl-beta-curcumene cyclase [Nitrosomonas europaea]SET15204.1 squalene-hopene/tetraprenyl-beta-curcumene cyclase [Nitrosomonas europaea]SJZ64109.1 squalene-hopene/tetraprenyl-beta-curcumene cyclase [Nitrosomonas europaea]HBF25310.1 squalene--hopene cyclase [Nitrosomonas sp.]
MSISPTFSGSSLQKSSLSDHSTISEPFTVVDRVNGISAVALDDAITRARSALLAQQREDGHWCFSLEADCTIPAEYILMMHFMDEIDTALERRIANFLRNRQVTDGHGGWPLYYGGDFDMSCSVKVYYALKLAGDSPEAAHMVRARNAILERGGAARSNVFTRLLLAMYRQIPWRGVPFVPAEIMLLPRWFPFHLSKVAYWSRTVMVPLSILCTLKAKAANPRNIHVRELFTVDPEMEKNYFPVRTPLNHLLLYLERLGSKLEPLIPSFIRRRALKKAEQWTIERLNGRDGLGAIFPAMVNAYEALTLLGYDHDHPLLQQCRLALRELLVNEGEDITWCQPCVSPVWDTVLASLALQEDERADNGPVRHALDWLVPLQALDQPGDWRNSRPDLPGGGWAFQYANPHYPDLDDTAAAAWALCQADTEDYRTSITRAADWLAGMQSSNGGFAAFDIDNVHYYLNEIPFADHGALLDPPSSDVTARCIGLLALNGEARHQETVKRGLTFLFNEQEPSGAWFGRWGTNYVYGTWSVLEALKLARVDHDHQAVKRAVQWLKSVQRADGGWGETNDSYLDSELAGQLETSTSFQTAWAVLGLMAAGEVGSTAVRNGIDYLIRTQSAAGLWEEPWFTAPGFPKVFYLKYHGYSKYFPLWALNRYRAMNSRSVV